jgi:hypothetical protein
VRDKRVTQNGHASDSSASPHTTVTVPDVPHGRPHHHDYPCTSSGGKDEVLATVSADIRNYTEPGEDLDWTKVSDPTERKRLQGVIGGRKYRERRLAAQGKGGSGGNYPGASGVGSYISNGYGPQRPYGYSKSRSPRAPSTDPVSAESRINPTSTLGTLLHKALGIQPGSSAPLLGDSSVSAQRSFDSDSGRKPVVHASTHEEPDDHWTNGRSVNYIERVQYAAAKSPSEDAVGVPDDEKEADPKQGGQGGYEGFFMSLMASATRKES